MTVAELIAKLSEFDPEALVALDGEDGVSTSVYVDEGGFITDPEWHWKIRYYPGCNPDKHPVTKAVFIG